MIRRLVVVTALVWAGCQTQTYQQFRSGMAEGYGKVVPGASNVNEAQFVRVQGALVPPISAAAKGCSIRTHEDDYAGFTIGFPDGWRLDYSTGTLLVEKDDQHYVGALVYPARMRRSDIPPERFATVFAQGLERQLRAQGGTFDLSEQRTNGTIATAAMTANVHGVPMRGELQVVEEPGFMTLEAYWAPEATLLADQRTLEQVLACFSRKTLITRKEPVKPVGHSTRIGFHDAPAPAAAPAAPLHAVSSRFFTLALPAGWKIKNENPNGIDLTNADGYEYVGFGYVIGPAYGTPAQYLQQQINSYYPGVTMLGYSQPQEPGWSILAVEWGGQARGQPIHGMSRMAQSANLRISIGWTAEPNHWQRDAATMAAIAATIKMTPAGVAQVRADIRQQLASYPPIRPSSLPASTSSTTAGGDNGMAGWEDATDRVNLSADDALRDQDRAVSPSTGEHYIVPTNAWSPSGPSGPGYYRALPGGGEERLDVENVISGTTE